MNSGKINIVVNNRLYSLEDLAEIVNQYTETNGNDSLGISIKKSITPCPFVEVRVSTPKGELVAAPTIDDEYPGINIYLENQGKNKDVEIPMALVEYNAGDDRLAIATYLNLDSDEPTSYERFTSQASE